MPFMAAPMYALVTVGSLTCLTALPGVFKPYSHMSTFMPESLPDAGDTKTNKQLTLFWFMAQKTNVMLGAFLICSAFTCPCLPLVGFAACLFLIRAGMGSWFMFGAPASYMGLNRKAVMPLYVLTFVMVAGCLTSIYLGLNDEDYMAFAGAMEAKAPEKFDVYPSLVYLLMIVAGFFTLANLPPIFVPSVALGSYFEPGALTTEKYSHTKMVELMRLNAVGWTLLSLAQLGGIFMAPDLSIYGPMVIAFNAAFAAMFVHNITKAKEYGFVVPPMLFFLILVTATAGAATLGLFLI